MRLLLAVCCVLVRPAWSLRDGAPEEACLSMNPGNRPGPDGPVGHVSWAQNLKPTPPNTREPPFHILVSQTTYKPYERIKLHLVAQQKGMHNYFAGVLLQARVAACQSNATIDTQGTAVGTFSMQEPSILVLKTMDCWYGQSTVTHRFPAWKVNETVTWIAPDRSVGNVVFRATFLRERQIFWTGVHSAVVRDMSVAAPPRCGASTITTSLFSLMTLLSLISALYL